MSFFKKLKNGLGVGTIKFELVVPGEIYGNSGQLEGDIVLTAKSEQLVKDVEAIFERVHTWDERESVYNSTTERYEDRWVQRSHTIQLGHFMDETPFEIASDEKRTIRFVIPFQPIDPQLASSSGGLMWSFMDSALSYGSNWRNERVYYTVRGDVDLEDVAFDKGDSKTIAVM